MTNERLAEIRAQYERLDAADGDYYCPGMGELLAEVDRLRTLVEAQLRTDDATVGSWAAEGAAERAAIVAWLRTQQLYARYGATVADDISHGDHLATRTEVDGDA